MDNGRWACGGLLNSPTSERVAVPWDLTDHGPLVGHGRRRSDARHTTPVVVVGSHFAACTWTVAFGEQQPSTHHDRVYEQQQNDLVPTESGHLSPIGPSRATTKGWRIAPKDILAGRSRYRETSRHEVGGMVADGRHASFRIYASEPGSPAVVGASETEQDRCVASPSNDGRLRMRLYSGTRWHDETSHVVGTKGNLMTRRETCFRKKTTTAMRRATEQRGSRIMTLHLAPTACNKEVEEQPRRTRTAAARRQGHVRHQRTRDDEDDDDDDDDDASGIRSAANKKCAHATTHQCPYLTDSNSTLCAPCSEAVAKGQPCG
ncbi:hypothetical protein DCS_03960 [Drechmeria coniospora]|uniref:Uncharacterized protein n=1 Tax=Drechmeria coniospora TaxID=98403 RepID=A0A151GIN9_DRECN|nr:hypothetical protein DCS_03960 [Drechmeria coniospora]KYK56954.1 hypothetical protein DCS_03960 [Drechmeria coniospora]